MDNAIKYCDLTGNGVKTAVSNVEINDMYYYGGKLYYSSTSKTVGTYCYDIVGGHTVKITDNVGEGFVMIDGKLWFIQTAVTYVADYPAHTGNGDGKLYCYDGTIVIAK